MSGTENIADTDTAWHFSYFNGGQNYSKKYLGAWAWAVRDVSVVPEPVSSTLFIIGGVTLGFRRFWKREGL